MRSDVRTLCKASIWHEASRIVYEEGFRALWKGNLVTIVHRLPYSSISFYAYERYKTVSKHSKCVCYTQCTSSDHKLLFEHFTYEVLWL